MYKLINKILSTSVRTDAISPSTLSPELNRTTQMSLSDDAVIANFLHFVILRKKQKLTSVTNNNCARTVCLFCCHHWYYKMFHRGALIYHWLLWVGISSGLGLLSHHVFLFLCLWVQFTKMCYDLQFPSSSSNHSNNCRPWTTSCNFIQKFENSNTKNTWLIVISKS